MLGSALYYPYIDIEDSAWLKSAMLFWDDVQTIAPSAIREPYKNKDTQICAAEGYLRPLHCDLHEDLLDDLGRRVLRLLEDPDWQHDLVWRNYGHPSQYALISADKMSEYMRMNMREAIGIHPAKMSPEMRSMFVRAGGMRAISTDKISPRLRHLFRDLATGDIPPQMASYRIREEIREGRDDDDTSWLLVNNNFAEIYMSALAALLAKEVQLSPLTGEEPSSGLNLKCLLDDVASPDVNGAKGALVSLVMESLRVDPDTPIKKLLAFRRSRADQLAELAGLFDDLKSKIEKSSSAQELANGAEIIFKNKIRVGLEKLKKELQALTIQSAWEGFQRAITVSVPAGGVLAATSNLSGPLLLGAGAFVTLADVGVKSHLARAKARAASPYTYLLDIERKFSVPKMID